MATLRELIVKIAYQVDNSGIRKMEQTTSKSLKRIEELFGLSEDKTTKKKQQAIERKKKVEFDYTQWWESQLKKQEALETKKNEAIKKLKEKESLTSQKIKEKEIARQKYIEESNLRYKMRLIVNSSKLEEQALRRSTKIAEREAQKRKDLNSKTLGTGIGIAGGTIAGLSAFGAGAVGASLGIMKLNDQINMNIARIGVLSGDMATAKDRFKEIIQVSNQTGQSVDSLSSLYGKITMASQEYGISVTDQLRTLKTVAKLSVLGGTPTTSQESGLLQLGQALGSATVQADEYRSIVEQLPALHRAVAKSIGMSASKLQLFIKNAKTTGSITGKELFLAILKAEEDAAKGFEKLPLTLARVTNQMKNSFLEIGMALGDQLQPVTVFLDKLAGKVEKFKNYVIKNKKPIGDAIKSLFDILGKIVDKTQELFEFLQPMFTWIANHSEEIKQKVQALLIVIGAMLVTLGVIWAIANPQIVLITASVGLLVNALTGVVDAMIKIENETHVLENSFRWLLDTITAFSDKWLEITNPVAFKLKAQGEKASADKKTAQLDRFGLNPLNPMGIRDWANKRATQEVQRTIQNVQNNRTTNNSFNVAVYGATTGNAKQLGDTVGNAIKAKVAIGGR